MDFNGVDAGEYIPVENKPPLDWRHGPIQKSTPGYDSDVLKSDAFKALRDAHFDPENAKYSEYIEKNAKLLRYRKDCIERCLQSDTQSNIVTDDSDRGTYMFVSHTIHMHGATAHVYYPVYASADHASFTEVKRGFMQDNQITGLLGSLVDEWTDANKEIGLIARSMGSDEKLNHVQREKISQHLARMSAEMGRGHLHAAQLDTCVYQSRPHAKQFAFEYENEEGIRMRVSATLSLVVPVLDFEDTPTILGWESMVQLLNRDVLQTTEDSPVCNMLLSMIVTSDAETVFSHQIEIKERHEDQLFGVGVYMDEDGSVKKRSVVCTSQTIAPVRKGKKKYEYSIDVPFQEEELYEDMASFMHAVAKTRAVHVHDVNWMSIDDTSAMLVKASLNGEASTRSFLMYFRYPSLGIDLNHIAEVMRELHRFNSLHPAEQRREIEDRRQRKEERKAAYEERKQRREEYDRRQREYNQHVLQRTTLAEQGGAMPILGNIRNMFDINKRKKLFKDPGPIASIFYVNYVLQTTGRYLLIHPQRGQSWNEDWKQLNAMRVYFEALVSRGVVSQFHSAGRSFYSFRAKLVEEGRKTRRSEDDHKYLKQDIYPFGEWLKQESTAREAWRQCWIHYLNNSPYSDRYKQVHKVTKDGSSAWEEVPHGEAERLTPEGTFQYTLPTWETSGERPTALTTVEVKALSEPTSRFGPTSERHTVYEKSIIAIRNFLLTHSTYNPNNKGNVLNMIAICKKILAYAHRAGDFTRQIREMLHGMDARYHYHFRPQDTPAFYSGSDSTCYYRQLMEYLTEYETGEGRVMPRDSWFQTRWDGRSDSESVQEEDGYDEEGEEEDEFDEEGEEGGYDEEGEETTSNVRDRIRHQILYRLSEDKNVNMQDTDVEYSFNVFDEFTRSHTTFYKLEEESFEEGAVDVDSSRFFAYKTAFMHIGRMVKLYLGANSDPHGHIRDEIFKKVLENSLTNFVEEYRGNIHMVESTNPAMVTYGNYWPYMRRLYSTKQDILVLLEEA